MAVTSSRCPGALLRSTQQALSSLKNVTVQSRRTFMSVGVLVLRSGAVAFIWTGTSDTGGQWQRRHHCFYKDSGLEIARYNITANCIAPATPGPFGEEKASCQAIGHAANLQFYRVLYREAHASMKELADVTLDGKTQRVHGDAVRRASVDHRRSWHAKTAATEKLLEIIMRCLRAHEHTLDFESSVEDWGKLLGESADTAMLDRLLHYGHVLQVRPTQLGSPMTNQEQ